MNSAPVTPKRLAFFERCLTLGVFLCTVAGGVPGGGRF